MSFQSLSIKLGLFIILSACGYLSACDFTVTIAHNLRLDGFHRNLTYDITIGLNSLENVALSKVWPYSDCAIGIKQHLPSGIYANPDELNELRRSNKLNAVTKKLNIELPAEQSEPSLVYIIHKATSSNFITWIPLHARYHKAVTYGGYAMNKILKPLLYMQCPGRILDNCKHNLTPTQFMCSSNSKEKCNWKEITYSLATPSSLTWPVPVGILYHYYVVTVVTAATIAIGAIYIIITIHEYKFIQDY